ncbi:MAG TPA: NAD(P)-binding protein [Xanthobacteraceae bacterium]|jgi:2-polyprenyl-6-methoxyphenol hydroxylase-like FAD-dependent oxidoreductase
MFENAIRPTFRSRAAGLKVIVVGAGPAGLYFSYLLKRQQPEVDIRVFEQNAPDATFGFGVVFSDRALEFLRDDDPDTYDLVTPRMESWSDIVLDVEHDSDLLKESDVLKDSDLAAPLRLPP